ncbi:ROK family protein [Egicoccus sp. AB-alg6-2]|uniref:ROK family protein n=1 Tax=Egicoccus sp. AB-alg6-2 TaxID=3242692 RepID=UPI00359E8932
MSRHAEVAVVGVDLGGTSVRVGLVAHDGRLLARTKAATDATSADAALAQIAQLVEAVAGDRWPGIAGIGVGIPAAVTPTSGRAALAPNIPGLAGRDVAAELAQALGRPVVVDNDVALALVGERWQGAARGVDDVVLLSLGTGAGAGIVSGGRLLRGVSGAAGEIADLPLPGPAAGRDGAWFEAAVGTAGLRARAATVGAWDGAEVLCDAVRDGDPLASETLDRWAADVAIGAMALVAVLDPALLVLGGGIGSRLEVLDAVTRALDGLTSRAPRIVTAALGDWAGVLGAAAQAISSAPAVGEVTVRQEPA